MRRALGLTQEEFAARYRIPLGTLRDWEQGRSEPDQPARAYLTVIARDPEGVRRALEAKPGETMPVPKVAEGEAFAPDIEERSNPFVSDFVLGFLGFQILFITFEPQTIVQSWLSAANATDIGTAAAMGPITNIDVEGVTIGVCDYGDYYWGKGPVGPTIPRNMIDAWWYIKGTDAVQTFP